MPRGIWSVALATLVMGTLAAPAAAAELRVPQDFRTIRKAVKAAQPGDTIVLAPKTYRESVVVKVPNVTIEGPGATWKPRRKNKPALTIRADGVTVTGIGFLGGAVRGFGADLALEDSVLQETKRRPAVQFTGDNARIERVTVARQELGKRTRASVEIHGDEAMVRDSFVQSVTQSAKAEKVGTEAAVVSITGNDALVSRTQVQSATVDAGIRITGDDARAVSNDTRLLSGDGVVVTGDRAQVNQHFAGNVQGTGVAVEGDRAFVTQCGVDSTPDCIHVTGDDARVSGNDLLNGTGRGILVEGDAAQVVHNDLSARFGEGITVDGNTFEITDNVFEPTIEVDPDNPPPPIADPVVGLPVGPGNPVPVAPACPMIVVRSDEGGQVRDNDIEFVVGTAIHVEGDLVHVQGNIMTGTGAATSAIVVVGDGNTVLDNDTRTSSDYAIDITGDQNLVCTNTLDWSGGATEVGGVSVEGDENLIDENIVASAPFLPDDRAGNAFVIDGNRNEIVGNRAIDSPGNGFLLAAGSGNAFVRNVAEGCVLDGFCLMNGADNVVDQCRATGSWGEGLDNRAIRTDLLNCWFRSNGGGDVVNTGTFDLYGANEVGNQR